MRVVVDARPLSHPQAGGFRSYVRGLIEGLALTEGVEMILYLDRPVAAGLLPGNFQTRILSPNRLKSDLFLFAQQVRKDAPDLVHGTVNYVPATPGTGQTLTLHDALGLKKYAWEGVVKRNPREKAMLAYWKVATLSSARRARRLLTASHGVATELSEVTGRPLSLFDVVYHGVQLPQPRQSVLRDERSVLAIASPDPRKNLACLYDALSQHSAIFCHEGSPRLDVVCTHVAGGLRAESELKARGITNYRLLSGLDDLALARAYAGATAFAFPSLREGFGLPPVEAMTMGTPVVASSAEPMPEILGDAALYFDPHSPEELARALAKILNDPSEARRRSELGRTRAARYTALAQGEGTLATWRAAA